MNEGPKLIARLSALAAMATVVCATSLACVAQTRTSGASPAPLETEAPPPLQETAATPSPSPHPSCSLVDPATTFSPSPSPPTLSEPPASGTSTSLHGAADFRRVFGLPFDESHIRRVAREFAPGTWGYALTPEEAASVTRQLDSNDDRWALDRFGQLHPEIWADVRTLGDSGLEVNLTAQVEEHEQVVRALVPASTTVLFRQVPNSLAGLEATAARIHADDAYLEEHGIAVTGVGVGMQSNRVFVEFTATSADAAAFLLDRYGGDMIDPERVDTPAQVTGTSQPSRPGGGGRRAPADEADTNC